MCGLLLFAILSSAPQGAPQVEETRFLESFVDAFNRLDWDVFRELFAEDASVFFPGVYRSERASGREAVEAGFRSVFDRWRRERSGPPYLDLRPLDVVVESWGDISLVTFHLKEGEALLRRTLVLRRVEGKLRIAHLHASSR